MPTSINSLTQRELYKIRGSGCVQQRLACSVGGKPTGVRVRSPVAWIAERQETEFLKPIDEAIVRMASESSGRNASEPIGGLENQKLRRSSPLQRGEDSTDRRN